MALAVLNYNGSNSGHHEFSADIGLNSFFRVVIGDHSTYRSYGVSMLGNRSFSSRLFGPISASKFGRVNFTIPASLFNRDHSYIQLISYKNQNEIGMAISNIERILPLMPTNDLPSIQFSQSTMEINKNILSIPFQYEEQNLSHPFFFKKLFEALPKVLPAVGNLLSTVGNSSEQNGEQNLGKQLIALMSDPEKLKQVLELIKGTAPVEVSSGEAVGVSDAQSISTNNLSSAQMDPMTIMTVISTVVDGLEKLGKIGQQINKDELDTLVKLNPGVKDDDVQGLLNQMSVTDYSTGMNMNPMDIMQLIGKITDGLEKLGKIGQQINKDELDTLIKLNPGVKDDDVQGLLNQMGISKRNLPIIKFKKSAIVRIKLNEITPIVLNGKNKVLFVSGRDFRLPIEIKSPKPIPSGIIQVVFASKDSEDVLINFKQRHNGSNGQSEIQTVIIPEYITDDLVPGEEYTIFIQYLWKGKQDKKYGASLSFDCQIASSVIFNGIKSKLNTFPLNDIDIHRSFWHKVWQSDFTDDVVRFEFELKYYYSIESDRLENAQMETIEMLDHERPRKMKGKMKSGLVLSPSVLNQLSVTIGGDHLTNDEQTALFSKSFIDAQNKAIRSSANYKGRSGEMAALWVYPEVALTEIELLRVDQISQNGVVQSFSKEVKKIPLIESAHIIGVQSDNS